MAGQRISCLFPALTLLLCAAAPVPEIVPPDLPAIELPTGADALSVDDEPLKTLIAAARASPDENSFQITAFLPRSRVGVGLWRVVWSAWLGASRDRPVARRESFVFVLPHGMTPVALTGKTDATAGNNAVHIARDANGFVHMVWTDAWRPGAHEGALYRRGIILPDGGARFDSDPVDVGPRQTRWNAFPALAVVGGTVHFVWQEDGTVRYRSLSRIGEAWKWFDDADTKIPGPGRDTGPAIAADAGGVHVLSSAGVYATSRDGGHTWTSETVPFGANEVVKTVSLTLEGAGRPLAAASTVVKGPPLSEEAGHGGYWTLRLRRRVAPGVWEPVSSPIDGRPEWSAPASANEDVLCDWVRVLGDRLGGLHVTWHGTAVDRIYAHDSAYYSWRAPDGVWRAPVPLREPGAARDFSWSYAPSLTLDGDWALPLVFYALRTGQRNRGFDSRLGLFHDGKSLAQPLPVTRFVEDSIVTGEPENALSAWFPGAAPSIVPTGDGRAWADILVALTPTGVQAPSLVVWQRLDLTSWWKAAGQ
jgi:hypothetical protein